MDLFLRLAGANVINEGRVETCMSNNWGIISHSLNKTSSLIHHAMADNTIQEALYFRFWDAMNFAVLEH